MSKITYALLTVFVVEFCLFYFAGQNTSSTSLFALLSNPSDITSNALYVLIFIAIGVFAASVIVPGGIVQFNTYFAYAGVAAAAVTFIVTLAHLYTYINTELAGYSVIMAQFIAIIITAPLIMFYLIAMIEWVRSN